ncbi:MAG: hypothetical protein V1855_02245 [bacterium]
MKILRKLLLVVGLVTFCYGGIEAAKIQFQKIYEKNKKNLEKRKLSFDFSNNLKLLPKAKETYVEAFMVRDLITEGGKWPESILRKMRQRAWNELQKRIVNNKTNVFFHFIKDSTGAVVAFALSYTVINVNEIYLELIRKFHTS